MSKKESKAKALKSFRLQLSFTAKEMGCKLGVAQQTVSDWENHYCPPIKYIKKYLSLAKKLDCKLTIEDIINDY